MALSNLKVVQLPAPESEKPPRRLQKGADYFEAGDAARTKESRVEYLDSREEVNCLVGYFLNKKDYRTAFYVVLGCNTGLRPSDLLEYKWRNIFAGDEFRSTHNKMERKTQKTRPVILNKAVEELAWIYRKSLGVAYHPDKFCFPSNGVNKSHTPLDWRREAKEDRVYSIESQPMNVRSMTRLIRNASKELGMYRDDRRVSSYSLRKTALNAPTGLIDGVERSSDVKELMESVEVARMLANHSKVETTLNHYLGVKQKIMKSSFENMNLGLEAILKHKEDIKWV